MPQTITPAAQKKAAAEFAKRWENRGYEKGETQIFWIDLLRSVYGVENPEQLIVFEEQVNLSHTSFIDATIPATHVMIEQKSLGKDLKKPIRQSDGTTLTPYQQAKRYAAELPYSKRPRWIIACNFAEFYIYDMENPQAAAECVLLKNLPTEYYRLQFLVNVKSRDIIRETEVSKEAGQIVGKLHDALLKEYHDPTNPATLQSLNKLCVRLVFLLYAESAGILGKRNMFRNYLQTFREQNMRLALLNLFDALSTTSEERDPYMDEELAAFPYVNGGLFDGEKIEIPRFTPEIIDLLIHQASEQFDWSEISPTIFGAVFESTLNPVTRRAGGMHYTSIENIHKVIDPLFLDDLKKELADIKAIKTTKTKRQKLLAFQNKLASLKFLDPACGSGNFLTESYLSLRRLENEILQELSGLEITFGFEGEHNPIKVSIHQFYGIEINDFAVAVTKAALWIAESQALQETENIVHLNLDFLPLKSYANIYEGNALRVAWREILPPGECNFIMGNPPFVGHQWRSTEQISDMEIAFHDLPKHGKLDYVCAWYNKGIDYMQGTNIFAAFVSTNSIVQGESVGILWQFLFDKKLVIEFAHRPFVWTSESNEQAAVHCVIVGFSQGNNSRQKLLFSGNQAKIAENINGYLLDAPNVFIQARSSSMANDVPKICKGSQPTDNQNLLLSQEEYDELVSSYPKAKNLIKRFVGASEFINNQPRYCLWLNNIEPVEYSVIPVIMNRLKKVADFRKKSPTESVRRDADIPMLFTQIRQPNESYLLIPRHSSQSRKYIPIGYMSHDVICGDANYMIPCATLYLFGVLTSNVHMAWTTTLCGRIKSDYRYSPAIYNNFPWPQVTTRQKEEIEDTAQAIIDARAKYPNSSLAILYGRNSMPPELTKAHQANVRAVMAAYGFDVKSMTEAECVARLMEMYVELTK